MHLFFSHTYILCFSKVAVQPVLQPDRTSRAVLKKHSNGAQQLFFFCMISWLVQSSVESESRPCAFSVRVCICVAISALALYSALM